MDVVVLRHGRTAYNAARRLQGQLDVPLDAVGLRQADEVAASLRGKGITRIVSSDLARASRTAAAVGRALRLPVLLDAGLREQHYGAWQGRTHEQVRATWPREHAAWARREGDPTGGERLVAVGERALAAVTALLPDEGTLLVVTHGDVARALLGRLGHAPEELPNCGWARVPLPEFVVQA